MIRKLFMQQNGSFWSHIQKNNLDGDKREGQSSVTMQLASDPETLRPVAYLQPKLLPRFLEKEKQIAFLMKRWGVEIQYSRCKG